MRTAADIMTRRVITVHPDKTVREVGEILAEHRINACPVVDENGHLQGIIAERDLVEQQRQIHVPAVRAVFEGVFVLGSLRHFERELRRISGQRVGDIMTREVVVAREESTIEEVAEMMVSRRIHTIPVVSDGHVVGIIGRVDIVRAILPPR